MRRYERVLGILALLCLLGTLLVWAGTVPPNVDQHRYPGNEQLVENYDAYVGSQAQVGGTVVQTDPVVLELTHYKSTREVIVRDVPQPVQAGDRIVVFGEVQPNSVIDSRTITTREPWEATYMYLISFIGGLWVLAGLIHGWRLDWDRWTIVPRENRIWTERDDA